MDILKLMHEEFGWFIWGLVGIGLLWFYTGGANSKDARDPYIKPLAPLDSGETYGGSGRAGTSNEKTRLNLPQAPAQFVLGAEQKIRDFFNRTSEARNTGAIQEILLSKKVFLDGTAGAQASDAQDEYIRIVAAPQANGNVSLTGMSIKGGALGTNVTLPDAANLPLLGTPHLKTMVSLPPGGRAIVTSGRSPIGTSFRVNMCTGYLNQFQTFTPDLRQECPEPLVELSQSTSAAAREESCQNFVKTIPRCRIYKDAFPSTISASCKAFITQDLNYNSCAQNNERSEGFLKNEWRLFLEKTSEIWKNKQEVIKLFDASNEAIDAITY